ncbi:MAG TPA: adenylyltransferase/cytidyltransferase family protein [bacterium]|jgi:cytidyltransferase-like protein|nr:adenylyltransferase/cytidyltransferase family protein [bacterium]HPY99301.1 adenylyltransferase/cytidyltransferase family protein [bacterium]HQB76118.1 adenylyltransferase/cytidyltransferase family protein [bacterium]HQQ38465.1 adenylyltransferase/cytidyltransferase family protein [bacterium]
MSLALSFGTFDNFHPGHAVSLQPASFWGDELLIVIAREVKGGTGKIRRTGAFLFC